MWVTKHENITPTVNRPLELELKLLCYDGFVFLPESPPPPRLLKVVSHRFPSYATAPQVEEESRIRSAAEAGPVGTQRAVVPAEGEGRSPDGDWRRSCVNWSCLNAWLSVKVNLGCLGRSPARVCVMRAADTWACESCCDCVSLVDLHRRSGLCKMEHLSLSGRSHGIQEQLHCLLIQHVK